MAVQTPRDADLDLDNYIGPLERLLLRFGDRVGEVKLVFYFTLMSIALSELFTWLIMRIALGRPFSETVSNYVLSVVIPLLVTPILALFASRFVSRMRDLANNHTDLVRSYRDLAEHDQLTGVFNRRGIFDREHSIEPGSLVALIDLDRFKEINDRHGHGLGDLALVKLSQRLSALAGPTGYVARTGGDEFVLVRPVAGAHTGAVLPTRIEVPVTEEVSVTATIGSTWYTESDDLDHAMQRADIVMYSSKEPRSRLTQRDESLQQARVVDGRGVGRDFG